MHQDYQWYRSVNVDSDNVTNVKKLNKNKNFYTL